METGLISVIIPCYNVAPYLKRCVDSVLNNTYRNLEVICINDGSPDNSLEILNSYSDDRMTVISHENKGLSMSRNIGIERARGEFICFIDSDDWIHERYFEILIEAQKKTQADVVFCNYKITHDDCADEEIIPGDVIKKRFIDTYDSSVLCDVVWCKLYKADFIGDTRFVSVFSEDKLFNARLLLNRKNSVCAITNSGLYYYYMRPNSLIHSFHEDRMLPVAEEFLKMSEEAEDSEIKTLFAERTLKIGLSTRYMTMFRKELTSYNKSCDDFLKRVLNKMSGFPFSRKVMYTIFVKFPALYRRFRKMKDPSLAEWENREIASQNAK